MVPGWGWSSTVVGSAGASLSFRAKLSDPFRLIPDGLREGGDTVS